MIVVMMGASGAGKTTVGRALAERLQWQFVDADDLHPPANIAKMASGIPLDDTDRSPWLARIHSLMAEAAGHGVDMVVACSALRARYRSELARDVPGIRWVFLHASRALLQQRLASRQGHFAGPALLDAQLATLEPPPEAIEVDANAPVVTLVSEICGALRLL